MTIPINIWRLARATWHLNKEKKIPFENRLRLRIAYNILFRANKLREQDIKWHSALQQAAAEEPGVGEARAALYRKVIARYGRWTYEAMKRKGMAKSDFPSPKNRIGDAAIFVLRLEGAQYSFLPTAD